jgi:hypothetical protein
LRERERSLIFYFPSEVSTAATPKHLLDRTDAVQKWDSTSTNWPKMPRDLYFSEMQDGTAVRSSAPSVESVARASIVMRSRTCLTQTAMLAELSVDKEMSVQNIKYSM